jgi:hypothetical protein
MTAIFAKNWTYLVFTPHVAPDHSTTARSTQIGAFFGSIEAAESSKSGSIPETSGTRISSHSFRFPFSRHCIESALNFANGLDSMHSLALSSEVLRVMVA